MPTLSIRQLRNRAVLFAAGLLLPVAYLWFSYLHSAYQQIRFIEREQLGLEAGLLLNNEVFRLDTHERPRLNADAEKLGLQIEFGLESAPPQQKFRRINELQAQISANSGLILDSDVSTYFLIAAAFAHGPEALNHLATAAALAPTATDPAQGETSITTAALDLAGQFGAAASEMRLAADGVDRSCGCPDDPPFDYMEIKRKLALYRESASDTVVALMAEPDRIKAMKAVAALLTPEALGDVGLRFDGFYTVAGAKIDEQLNLRLHEVWREIGFTSGIGLLISTLGMGIATRLYRHNVGTLGELQDALAASRATQQHAEQMSADIGKLNSELAAKIGELEQAQNDLLDKSRLEQLGKLTGTIAHEIRNPMGSIRTAAFLIQKKLSSSDVGLTTQLARINKGVERCDKIITQLLDYSRTRKIDATPQDLDHWIEETLRDDIDQVPRAIHFVCDLGLARTPVSFDATRMRRALTNLISNASEAMLARAPENAPTIWITTRLEAGHATLEVRDNGPGIAPDVMPRILEPLFTTKGFGTGLGLPAVDQIARLHGGRLEVTSQPGQGASFKMFLALHHREAEADAA